MAQAGVKRGALVGHGKGAVGVGEVVEEGPTWDSNQHGQAGEDVTNTIEGKTVKYCELLVIHHGERCELVISKMLPKKKLASDGNFMHKFLIGNQYKLSRALMHKSSRNFLICVWEFKSWTSDCEPDGAEACVRHGVGNLRINLVNICFFKL